jgi:hypothetical protein
LAVFRLTVIIGLLLTPLLIPSMLGNLHGECGMMQLDMLCMEKLGGIIASIIIRNISHTRN